MKYFLLLCTTLTVAYAVVPFNPARQTLVGKPLLHAKLQGFQIPLDKTTANLIAKKLSGRLSAPVAVWQSEDSPLEADLVFSSDSAPVTEGSINTALSQIGFEEKLGVTDLSRKIAFSS